MIVLGGEVKIYFRSIYKRLIAVDLLMLPEKLLLFDPVYFGVPMPGVLQRYS